MINLSLLRYIRKYRKPVVLALVGTLLADALIPISAWAITGHNSMPEYWSFEPVSTTNMVNVFNGSFTHNIPIIDVPNGYPLSLAYHSNEISPEAQASWVGLGWSLNPGAIYRVKRGFPDDYYNDQVR